MAFATADWLAALATAASAGALLALGEALRVWLVLDSALPAALTGGLLLDVLAGRGHRGGSVQRVDDEPRAVAVLAKARTPTRRCRQARHPRELLTKLLTRLGYQPREDGQSVVLANCPFLRLRAADTQLVCSINAALAAGCSTASART